MSIRTFFMIIACFMFLLSCRDADNRNDNDTLNAEENEFSPVDRNIPREEVDEDELDNEETTSQSTTRNSQVQEPRQRDTQGQNTNNALSGQFIKIGQEGDSNCGCYCLDLSASMTELCLVEGKMYINTRLQKNSDNTIDVFLVEPAARNTEGKDMPWNDFDRNSTIATIKPKSNGELEFDWLGFKINGDLAVDYAIFGKKTLEGDYKKK